jgi:peptidoglycan/LPS O-acetylase OafA/YrhL
MEKDRSADGLRGLAALCVAISHFVGAFLPSGLHSIYPENFPPPADAGAWSTVLTSPIPTLFYNGHFAVLVFFAISGYVLTMPFYRDGDHESLRRRLWGRYIRLNVPIAAAVAIAYSLYASGMFSNGAAGKLSGSLWLQQYFPPGLTVGTAVREGAYASILLGATTLDPPLWSLKIEFIGSLYLLAFHLALPRFRRVWAWLTVAVLLVLVHGPDAVYYATIFAGALINRVRLDRASMALVFVLGCYCGAFQPGNVIYAPLPSTEQGIELQRNLWHAAGGLLLTASVASGFARALFESAPVRFLGRVSFSLYLLHFLVLCSLASWMFLWLPLSTSSLVLVFVTYLAVCFAIAVVFDRFVDRGAIALSRRVAAGPDHSPVRWFFGLFRRSELR